jgi:hypothetical protein
MQSKSLRTLTAILTISVPLLLTALFTLLGATFSYPEILRMPTGQVLERFQAGGSGLIAIWYAMTLTTALFIPLILLIHLQLAPGDGAPYMHLATGFGVISGVVQILGFIRWPFLVPYLARVYFDATASQATRDAAVLAFQVFNQYAGVGVGEHLGYLFTGLWTIFVAIALLKSGRFPAWLAWTGLCLAAGVLAGMLEPAGVAWAGMVNFIAFTLWAFWLAAFGVALLRIRA